MKSMRPKIEHTMSENEILLLAALDQVAAQMRLPPAKRLNRQFCKALNQIRREVRAGRGLPLYHITNLLALTSYALRDAQDDCVEMATGIQAIQQIVGATRRRKS